MEEVEDVQDSLLLRAAVSFAQNAHQDQKYGTEPYVVHLQDVARVLYRFGVRDDEVLAAAFLHDVVEDTDATIDQVRLMFGRRVADLVYRVTNEEGANRKERHTKTYPKIKESEDALQLKLADRIANVESSMKNNQGLLKMYKEEWPGFKEALHTPGVHQNMWNHLIFLLEKKQ